MITINYFDYEKIKKFGAVILVGFHKEGLKKSEFLVAMFGLVKTLGIPWDVVETVGKAVVKGEKNG